MLEIFFVNDEFSINMLHLFIYYYLFPVVERTDFNVNFGIHKSVAMVSVVQEQFLYFQ